MSQKNSIYTIENDILNVTVKAAGAELCGLFDKRDDTEHLWQADPGVWGKHAPILFPVIGKVLNGHILVDGERYPHPKHGFFRPSTPDLLRHSDQEIWFELTDSDETRAMYPFSFRFRTGYQVDQHTLHHLFEVENTGESAMPFCLGGHPAFRVPFFEGETITDYQLRFEHRETSSRLLLDNDGFFNGKKRSVLTNESTLKITQDLFNEDALVFDDLTSREVSLESPRHAKKLTLAFGDFPMLGIWSQPGAEFVCIEPWIGRADDSGEQLPFDQKPGIQHLPAGDTFRASFSIRLEKE